MPPASRTRPVRRRNGDADLVALAELEAEILMRGQDSAAGLVPSWATRALLPFEVAARVSFAAIDADVEAARSAIARRLVEDRQRVLERLTAHLATFPGGAAAVAELQRLPTRGLLTVPGVGPILSAAELEHRAALVGVAARGGGRVLEEAARQGVAGLPALVPMLDPTGVQLDQAAWRLAVQPHLDLLRALEEEAVRMATPATAGELAGHLAAHGAGLSTAPLDVYARSAASAADNLGRQDAAQAAPEPSRIYASELLDGRQCLPCDHIDGTEYPDLETARADYPTGTYRLCEGGYRCRGTLVFVWDEAAPTLASPHGPGYEPPPPIAPAPPPPPPAPAPAPLAPPRPTLAPVPPAAPLPPAPIVAPDPERLAALDAARADLAGVRAQARSQAAAIAEESRARLDAADVLKIDRPPALVQRPGPSGRVQWLPPENIGGEWDWFWGLDPQEQKRIRTMWSTPRQSGAGQGAPDQVAERWVHAFGGDAADVTGAMEAWLQETRRVDMAGALARGKVPKANRYSGVPFDRLAGDASGRWRIDRIFANDDAAIDHIATVYQREAADFAARSFRAPVHGPPPYAMSPSDFADEVRLYEQVIPQLRPVSTSPELGDVWDDDAREAFERMDELIPAGVEDPGSALPLDQLHARIVELARLAGLLR